MTPGEVARSLDRLSGQLERMRAELQPVIARDAADAEWRKVVEDRLEDLESWQTWAARLVLSAVILGVMSLVFVTG